MGEPSQLSKTEFLSVDRAGFEWVKVADRVYDSLRSYRRDHCAIFIDSDTTDDFLRSSGLQAGFLDPDESWHWTGAQARRNLKPILVCDYEDWFRWFMKCHFADICTARHVRRACALVDAPDLGWIR